MAKEREYEEVTVQVPIACERAFVLLHRASEILKDDGYDRFASEIEEIRDEIADIHIPPSKQEELKEPETKKEFLHYSTE